MVDQRLTSSIPPSLGSASGGNAPGGHTAPRRKQSAEAPQSERPTGPIDAMAGSMAFDVCFLTGAQKSGTTWVGRILNSHPEIAMRGESWLFGPDCDVDVWLDSDRFAEWLDLPLSAWIKQHGADDLRLAVTRGMAEAVLRLRWRPGVRVIGDRTPYFYATAIERIHQVFPDARIIFVVRDARDVAVSHMFHLLRTGKLRHVFDDPQEAERRRAFHIDGVGAPLPLFNERALCHFADRWLRSIEAGRLARELYGDRMMEIRYESLSDALEPEVSRWFEFLGVRASPALIQGCIGRHEFERLTGGRERGDADPRSFMRMGQVGDWRRHFRDEDVAIFKSRVGEKLIEAGYERNLDW